MIAVSAESLPRFDMLYLSVVVKDLRLKDKDKDLHRH